MTTATNEPIVFKSGSQAYSLKMGFNSICRMEEQFEKPFTEIFGQVFGNDMRMADFLTVLHCCLTPDTVTLDNRIDHVTREEAADIIDILGLEKVSALVRQAADNCPLLRDEEPAKKKPRVRGAAAKFEDD